MSMPTSCRVLLSAVRGRPACRRAPSHSSAFPRVLKVRAPVQRLTRWYPVPFSVSGGSITTRLRDKAKQPRGLFSPRLCRFLLRIQRPCLAACPLASRPHRGEDVWHLRMLISVGTGPAGRGRGSRVLLPLVCLCESGRKINQRPPSPRRSSCERSAPKAS